MKKPARPEGCGVRGCLGSVKKSELKGAKILQCDAHQHHKAWMVSTESGVIEWQFVTRGRSSVKGTVVESVDKKAKASDPPPLTDQQEVAASEAKASEKPPTQTHDEAEISAPSDNAEIAVPSPQAADKAVDKNASEKPLPQGESESTPPKLTFLEKKRLREEEASASAEKKAKSSSASSPPSQTPEKKSPADNVKRGSCEICSKPRTSAQRGAACPQCLYSLRQVAGHQSLSLVRDNEALKQKVLKQSDQHVHKDSQPSASSADSKDERMDRVESMLAKLLTHFGLD